MKRSWLYLLGIFLSMHMGFASEENIARRRNVHGHIVSVNEAHEEARRQISDTTAIEEEIIATNEDPNRRPECKLFEGDLCLDPEDMNLKTSEQDRKRNIIKNKDKLWLNHIVYYSVDSNLQSLRPLIDQAVTTFEDHTCLTFREVSWSYDNDHIRIISGNGCWSKVGRSGGRQLLSLGSGCEYIAVILHELMHAVGIWHEQSRPDRDDYVTIFWSNIASGKESRFTKYGHGKLDTLNLPYDFESLMHYDQYAYSVDGKKKTIIAKDRPYKTLGGNVRGTLTTNDIRELNALYNCETSD